MRSARQGYAMDSAQFHPFLAYLHILIRSGMAINLRHRPEGNNSRIDLP